MEGDYPWCASKLEYSGCPNSLHCIVTGTAYYSSSFKFQPQRFTGVFRREVRLIDLRWTSLDFESQDQDGSRRCLWCVIYYKLLYAIFRHVKMAALRPLNEIYANANHSSGHC